MPRDVAQILMWPIHTWRTLGKQQGERAGQCRRTSAETWVSFTLFKKQQQGSCDFRLGKMKPFLFVLAGDPQVSISLCCLLPGPSLPQTHSRREIIQGILQKAQELEGCGRRPLYSCRSPYQTPGTPEGIQSPALAVLQAPWGEKHCPLPAWLQAPEAKGHRRSRYPPLGSIGRALS